MFGVYRVFCLFLSKVAVLSIAPAYHPLSVWYALKANRLPPMFRYREVIEYLGSQGQSRPKGESVLPHQLRKLQAQS